MMGTGSTMKADGTMTSSPGMTKLEHEMSAKTCSRGLAMMFHGSMKGAHCFKVRIDNISTPSEFTASNGVKWTLPFSPGTFVATAKPNPFFEVGTRDRKVGLRALSEAGDPTALTAFVAQHYPDYGAFLVPLGGTKPKGILPGQAFEFFVVAGPSEKLYFVTMHGQSNDWFYGNPSGIALFDAAGKALGGDATAQVKVFDAGTEADEELGIGPSQGPRQPRPRYGPPDSNPLVRAATTDKRFLDTTSVMRVTVTPQ